MTQASEIVNNVQCIITQVQALEDGNRLAIVSSLRDVELALKDEAKRWSKVVSKAPEQRIFDYNRLFLEAMELVKRLRAQYPDDSPIRINAGKFGFLLELWPRRSEAFAADARRPAQRAEPALIAYVITLVLRVFNSASQTHSTLTLKLLRILLLSFASLAPGGPNRSQTAALDLIPQDIRTLESQFSLDVQTIAYAICPACGYTQAPAESPNPTYPTNCRYESPFLGLCDAPILKHGKPLKVFHYRPFLEWFGKFAALPDISSYADQFSAEVSDNAEERTEYTRTSDGWVYRTLAMDDGKSFFLDRGDEGRWVFLMLGDFFNIEGNRIGGKANSTGMMALVCLNLPWHIRYDPAYIYMPGVIQGPKEPDAKQGHHQHFLRPLVDDLLVAYRRGVQSITSTNKEPRTERCALAGTAMDFKAARPFAGLMDVTSHTFCIYCELWHTSQLSRTDYESWRPKDHSHLQKGFQLWEDAVDQKTRVDVEQRYGTRSSEFRRLPYWNAVAQVAVDPMHAGDLIIFHKFFREALRLDNPRAEKDPKNETNPPISHIAFYHNFTPPPPLSTLSSAPMPPILDDGGDISSLKWPSLKPAYQEARAARINELNGSDSRMRRQILEGRQHISDKVSASSLRHILKGYKRTVLLFLCLDVMAFPPNGQDHLLGNSLIKKRLPTKYDLAEALISWVCAILLHF